MFTLNEDTHNNTSDRSESHSLQTNITVDEISISQLQCNIVSINHITRRTNILRENVVWIAVFVVVVVVAVVLTLTRIIKSVVTGQAPVTLELRNTPGKITHNPRWYPHISQPTQFMPPPERYKSEIGSLSTMCQIQAGAYVSLLTPGETKYSDCHPRKTTTTYILHVVSITTHTHERHKSIGEKETKKRKEDKGKERKEKKKTKNYAHLVVSRLEDNTHHEWTTIDQQCTNAANDHHLLLL